MLAMYFTAVDIPQPVAGPSKKRRRGSASTADGSQTDSDVMANCRKMVDHMMTQFRQEERAYVSQQVQQLKIEILEHIDKRLKDFQDTIPSEDAVDIQISQHVASFDDLVDVKIEDRVTGIRMELEDFVEGEVAGAEERVMQRVREANWTFHLEE